MLIPLIKGKRKSTKDMTSDERKDFESAEARAKSEKPRKAKLNKHPGLRPVGVSKDAKADSSAKKAAPKRT